MTSIFHTKIWEWQAYAHGTEHENQEPSSKLRNIESMKVSDYLKLQRTQSTGDINGHVLEDDKQQETEQEQFIWNT